MKHFAQNQNLITEEQRQKFKEEGYLILKKCVPDEHLQLLRRYCQGFVDRLDAKMTALGVDRIDVDARGKRYFPSRCYEQQPELGNSYSAT